MVVPQRQRDEASDAVRIARLHARAQVVVALIAAASSVLVVLLNLWLIR
jgi:hypothetical protein